MKRLLLLLVAIAAVAAAQRAGAERAAAEPAHTGYPNSIAVLGDSSATGYNADSAKPPHDERTNSWVTGDNPAVASIYSHILAVNPKIKYQAANVAKPGAPIGDLVAQAQLLVRMRPEYVVMSEQDTPDYCNGVDDPVGFQAQWVQALHAISIASPNARILVPSLVGGVGLLDAVKASPEGRAAYADGSLCDPLWDSSGEPNPDRVAFIGREQALYSARMAAACARFIHCRTDGGALARLQWVPGDLSSDFGHPSVQGLAKIAAAEWAGGFDFTDAKAPVSRGRIVAGKVVLTATDASGVAGLEYKLNGTGAWIRYAQPVSLAKGKSIVWRAVDVNGNCEATHMLRR